MRAVIMMFDSLNRHMLEPYGGTAYTPNFARLAEHSAQFDTSYACSLPCMPARRELHTGRPNFLHSSGISAAYAWALHFDGWDNYQMLWLMLGKLPFGNYILF